VHQLPLARDKSMAAARRCDECGAAHAVRDGELWVESHRAWRSLGLGSVLHLYVATHGKVYNATELGQVSRAAACCPSFFSLEGLNSPKLWATGWWWVLGAG
jgi:hypothetical protein